MIYFFTIPLGESRKNRQRKTTEFYNNKLNISLYIIFYDTYYYYTLSYNTAQYNQCTLQSRAVLKNKWAAHKDLLGVSQRQHNKGCSNKKVRLNFPTQIFKVMSSARWDIFSKIPTAHFLQGDLSCLYSLTVDPTA